MSTTTFFQLRRLQTRCGCSDCVARGHGPAAWFVHGALFNSNLRCHQLAALDAMRAIERAGSARA